MPNRIVLAQRRFAETGNKDFHVRVKKAARVLFFGKPKKKLQHMSVATTTAAGSCTKRLVAPASPRPTLRPPVVVRAPKQATTLQHQAMNNELKALFSQRVRHRNVSESPTIEQTATDLERALETYVF
jgi:hypothetical protein